MDDEQRAERAVAGAERAALLRTAPVLAIAPIGFSGLFLMGVLNGAWGFGIGIAFEVGALYFFQSSFRRRLPATRAMAAGAAYHQEGRHDLLWGWLLMLGGVYAGFGVGPQLQDVVESLLGGRG